MLNNVPKSFRPDMRHAFYFIRKELYKKIKEYATEMNGRMMDFGCGSKPYQSLFTNVQEYIGVDYAGEGHTHANEQVDVIYDGKEIPFPDDYFDSVFSSEVFEHIFNLEVILPEIARVMKKDGKLLITCPFVWNEHEVPADYARYTQFALKYLLERNGFSILVQDKTGDFLKAIHQMRVVYFNQYGVRSIPLLGRWKLFRTTTLPFFNSLLNGWFSFKHLLLPKRDDLYLNNIVLAKKN